MKGQCITGQDTTGYWPTQIRLTFITMLAPRLGAAGDITPSKCIVVETIPSQSKTLLLGQTQKDMPPPWRWARDSKLSSSFEKLIPCNINREKGRLKSEEKVPTTQTQRRKSRQNRKSFGIRNWKLHIFHSHQPFPPLSLSVIFIGSVNYAYDNRYNLVLIIITKSNGLVWQYTWELSPSYLVCWPDRAICKYIQN